MKPNWMPSKITSLQGSNCGLFVLEGEYHGGLSCVRINATPRRWCDPFEQATAILRRCAVGCANQRVVVTNYGPLKESLGLFHRMFHRVVRKHAGVFCSTIDQDALELSVKLRATQYPPALDPSVMNVVGHMDLARFVFVGEQTRKVYRGFDHWPFHANSGCTVYLAQCLDRLNVNEDQIMFTNIHAPDQHVHALASKLRVVALGNESAKGLARLKVDFIQIPHPQWARRFRHHTRDYESAIRIAIL